MISEKPGQKEAPQGHAHIPGNNAMYWQVQEFQPNTDWFSPNCHQLTVPVWATQSLSLPSGELAPQARLTHLPPSPSLTVALSSLD